MTGHDMKFDIRTKGTSYFTEGDPEGVHRVEFTITGGGSAVPAGTNYVQVFYSIKHNGTDADDFAGETTASRLIKVHVKDGHMYLSDTVHFNIKKDDLVERDEKFTVTIDKVVYANHQPGQYLIPIETQDLSKDGKTPPTSDPVWIFNDDYPPAAKPLVDKIGELKEALKELENAPDEGSPDEEDPAKKDEITALKGEIKALEDAIDELVEEEVKAREAESKRKAEEDANKTEDGAPDDDGTMPDMGDTPPVDDTMADDVVGEDEDSFNFDDRDHGPEDAMPGDTTAFQHDLAAHLGLDGMEVEAFIDTLAPLGFEEATFSFADHATDAEQSFEDFFLAQGIEGEVVFDALEEAAAAWDFALDMAEFAFLTTDA